MGRRGHDRGGLTTSPETLISPNPGDSIRASIFTDPRMLVMMLYREHDVTRPETRTTGGLWGNCVGARGGGGDRHRP